MGLRKMVTAMYQSMSSLLFVQSQKWKFKNFTLDTQKTVKTDESISLFFGETKCVLYQNCDIEIASPVYQKIIERFDFATPSEGIHALHESLMYLDNHFESLQSHPHLIPEPLLDRIFGAIQKFFKKK